MPRKIDFARAHAIAKAIRPWCTSYRAAFKLACLELSKPQPEPEKKIIKRALALLTFAAAVVTPLLPALAGLVCHLTLGVHP